MSIFRRLPIAIAALIALTSACSDSSTSVNAPPTARISEGDHQTGAVGEVLTTPLSVTVTDGQNRPVRGRQIVFTVTSGGGTLSPTEATTTSDGIASTQWTLGTSTAVDQKVTAKMVENSSDTTTIDTFTAVPVPGAAQIAAVSGSGQAAAPNTVLGDSLIARVADRFGNPIENEPVTWAVTSGGGALSATTTETDSNGYARTQWTLGATIGPNTATATINGVAPVEFSANASVVAPDIVVKILSPTANRLFGDTLLVSAVVTSTYQLATVIANIGTHQAALTYSTSERQWIGTMLVSTLAFGPSQLTVTATNVNNSTTIAAVTVNHDAPPRLTVIEPSMYTIATPSIRFRATCEDVDATGCTQLRAAINGHVVASGVSTLDATVSLAAYSGYVTLSIYARDAANQLVITYRTLIVASLQNTAHVLDVPGLIIDVVGNRVLYVDTTNASIDLKIRNVGGSDLSIFQQANGYVASGYLTASGAIFVTQPWQGIGTLVREYRNGVVTDLGGIGSSDGLVVNGGYALWHTGINSNRLNRRDLASGTNTTIASNVGNWKYDVTASGDVAYWSNKAHQPSYQIILVPNGGSPVKVTNDSTYQYTYVLTDGTSVVYRRHQTCCSTAFQLMLWTQASGEVVLAPGRTLEPNPGPDYQVKNGWIAYTKVGGADELQVWVRSPSGAEKQLTFYGSSSRLDALGANGEVVFTNGGQRYMSVSPHSVTTPLGTPVGVVVWRDGGFYVLIEGSLFRIG